MPKPKRTQPIGDAKRKLTRRGPSAAKAIEVTTLLGEEGRSVTRKIFEHTMGLRDDIDLGAASSKTNDGTLLLYVDQATFQALELDR
jgi:hypothetical protein